MAYDWRHGLPILRGRSVTLREPTLADAGALYARLTTQDVARYISTPPTSAHGFERFVSWVQHERSMGRHACFGLVPDGMEELAGLVQVRQLEADFGTAEWGFAIGDAFWGTGLFMASAPMVIDFAFRDARFHRLEARASVDNLRGNRVLEKLGAAFEGTLRDSFVNNLLRTDQMMWAIVADEWLAAHPAPSWLSSAPVEKPPEAEPYRRPPPPAPWRAGLPELRGQGVTVRELQMEDAENLAALFADPDVGRYIPPPPSSGKDFTRFINWAHEQRLSGSVLCFAIVPDGCEAAVGVLQLHELQPPFQNVEWGFVLGKPVLGNRALPAGDRGAPAVCLRHDWRAAPRGPCDGRQRPGQRRAPPDGRDRGRTPAPVLPPWRPVPRRCALVHSGCGLAPAALRRRPRVRPQNARGQALTARESRVSV